MREARGEARSGAREWRAGDAPPLGLLRLREAGIVRLCGLDAASRGLDLAARRALSQLRRDGPRLSALVGADEPVEAWIETIEPSETSESLTLAAMRWGCAAHTQGAPAAPASLGCEHVAAVLSAWVRAPGDFRTPAAPQEAPPAPDIPAPPDNPPLAVNSPTAPAKPARPGPRAPASLADELHRLPERELQALTRRALGGDGATPARTAEETLATLESALRDPDALARLLARLEPEARETLAWLRLAGGAMTVAGLEALATRSGRPVSALRGVLATLERHALLFPNLLPDDTAPVQPGEPRERSWRGVSGWRIAPETRAALPRELPIQPLTRAEIAAERPRIEKASPRALLLALALLPRARAPLGPPPSRDLDASPGDERGPARDAGGALHRGRVGVALMPEDLPEAALLAAARSAGLSPDAARIARRVMLWARDWDGAASGATFTLSAGATAPDRLRAYQAAFATWRAARSPADLVDLERVTGTVRMRYDHTHEAFRPAALADEAAAARGWVARLLGLATPGAWYRVDDLVELVWRVNPYFLRGKQLAWRTPVWRLERVADGRPLRPTIHEEWSAAEGAYLRALLAGPLHLWGALDLALDGSGAPRLFRLALLGAALLARPPHNAPDALGDMDRAAALALAFDWGPAATLTKEGALAVQPLAATPTLLDALEQWAEVTSLAGGRLLYTFTPVRALARFDDGMTPEQALAPLRAAGLVRAAQTLAPRLEGWRQGYGDARLTSGLAIVEGRDEATLREALAAAPDIAARARRLGPAAVALSHADAETLRAALAKKGWEL